MSDRERSYWGWGWADRFPDASARRTLGAQVGALLGFSTREPVEPVALDEIDIAPARVGVPARLAGFTTDDDETRARHTYGRAWLDIYRGFIGDFRHAPDLVAFPESEDQIRATLAWAATNGARVVPWGGGTSVVRGTEPFRTHDEPVIALSLRRMNSVLEVDVAGRSARIQAGALGPEINAELGEVGLQLRHFPQSFEFSTLGGWVATRAGGHFATVYTHIDDLVASTRMVTADDTMQTRRLPGSGAGPSPDRLVLGSEGILGVITEAWVRVHQRPRYRSNASVLFNDFDEAVAAVRAISQCGLHPTNCRLLDSQEAMLNMVTTDGSSVLILAFESPTTPVDQPLEAVLKLALDAGGRCPAGAKHSDAGESTGDGGAAGSWKRAFFDGPYLQSTLLSLGIMADTFETAVTWDRFSELHAAIVRDVRAAMKATGGRGTISCRFTHVYPDGPAPYYTFLTPMAEDPEAQWWTIKRAAMNAINEYGGTVTHHHAVGHLHREGYDQQRPELFARVLRAAKSVTDPASVLNPGVLIDPDESSH